MTYEVRVATEADRRWVIHHASKDMIEQEVKRKDLFEPHQLHLLYHRVVKDGTGLICWKDGKRVGMIGGILLPHHLKPEMTVLTEIVWYIDPDYRQTRATLKLIQAYKGLIDEKADEGIFTLLAGTPIEDASMARFGFQPYERNFIYRK